MDSSAVFFTDLPIVAPFFPTGVINSLQDAINGGKVGKIVLLSLAFAVCYIIVPVLISIGIFDKKELDF